MTLLHARPTQVLDLNQFVVLLSWPQAHSNEEYAERRGLQAACGKKQKCAPKHKVARGSNNLDSIIYLPLPYQRWSYSEMPWIPNKYFF